MLAARVLGQGAGRFGWEGRVVSHKMFSATGTVILLKHFSLCFSHTVSSWETFPLFDSWSISPHPSRSSSKATSSVQHSLTAVACRDDPCLWNPTLGSGLCCSPPTGSLFWGAGGGDADLRPASATHCLGIHLDFLICTREKNIAKSFE